MDQNQNQFQPPSPPTPQNNGFYAPTQPTYDGDDSGLSDATQHDGVVEWEASEYVQHSKGPGWYVLVVIATLVGVGVALYFTQWLFAVLIGVMGVAFIVFGMRKPRVLHYRLSDSGLVIGDKVFHLDDFRSFGVRADGAFYTVMLVPVKRLSPGLNIYFSEANGDQILDILGSHLPMEKMAADPIDILMHKLRF